jgi:hypothetical protein
MPFLMFRRLRRATPSWGGLVLALGCASAPAWAGPVDDLKSGLNLYVNSVTINFDGEVYGSGGYVVPKLANNLDLTLTGTALGLGFPEAIHGTASVSGSVVTWTINDHYNPPITLDGNDVQRIHGQMKLRVEALPGAYGPHCSHQPCSRNVSLSPVPGGTHIWIEGESSLGIDFQKEVTLQTLGALGGVAQPGLKDFYVDNYSLLCSSETKDTEVPLMATLTSVTPFNGAKVDLKSSWPPGVQVPPVLTAKQGQTVLSTNIIIKKGFSGLVMLTASASGAMRQELLAVEKASACESAGNGKKPHDVVIMVPNLDDECIRCGTFISINNAKEWVIRREGQELLVINGERVLDLASQLGAQQVLTTGLTDSGFLTGRMTPVGGTATAFRALFRHGEFAPEPLGNFTPTAITERGLVAGYETVSTGFRAVYHDGTSLKAVPLSASSSKTTGAADNGHLIGTFTDAAGLEQGFHFVKGAIHPLTGPGGTPALPVAVNARGQVAANWTDSAGKLRGVLFGEEGAAQQLETPAGFTNLKLTALNALGWVTATASQGQTTHGFLYTPQEGWVDLDQLAGQGTTLQVLEALAVTDTGHVAVRARVNGSEALYLMTPRTNR